MICFANKSARTEGAAAFRAVLVAKRHDYAKMYICRYVYIYICVYI